MPSAELITIGTEILLGEIVDTNAAHLARRLRDLGVDLFRKTSVGDNPQRIAEVVRQALQRADFIITTGGLGPTIDDPTREAIALAAGVSLEYHPELWEQIRERFRRFNRLPTENNKRQAYLPQGALPIENPVGTAPSFIVEIGAQSIICLPGVPREMEHLLENDVIPYLRRRFPINSIIKARVLHTSGAGESQIDALITDLETLTNPTVGLAAHAGQVDVRITAKAANEAEANLMIAEVEQELRKRLADWVFGADEETLEAKALAGLEKRNWRLAAIESGLSGFFIQKLANRPQTFIAGQILTAPPKEQALKQAVEDFRAQHAADVGLGVVVSPNGHTQEVMIYLLTPEKSELIARPYGGPPANAPRWAANHCLDILRRQFNDLE